MNFISKFNHSFTNRDCLHCANTKKKEPTRQTRKIYAIFAFKIFKRRFSRFWKCLKTTRNSPRTNRHTHYIFILPLLMVIIMAEFLKVLNAVELHFLKSLKVNCSNKACSSPRRPIFDK